MSCKRKRWPAAVKVGGLVPSLCEAKPRDGVFFSFSCFLFLIFFVLLGPEDGLRFLNYDHREVIYR